MYSNGSGSELIWAHESNFRTSGAQAAFKEWLLSPSLFPGAFLCFQVHSRFPYFVPCFSVEIEFLLLVGGDTEGCHSQAVSNEVRGESQGIGCPVASASSLQILGGSAGMLSSVGIILL